MANKKSIKRKKVVKKKKVPKNYTVKTIRRILYLDKKGSFISKKSYLRRKPQNRKKRIVKVKQYRSKLSGKIITKEMISSNPYTQRTNELKLKKRKRGTEKQHAALMHLQILTQSFNTEKEADEFIEQSPTAISAIDAILRSGYLLNPRKKIADRLIKQARKYEKERAED